MKYLQIIYKNLNCYLFRLIFSHVNIAIKRLSKRILAKRRYIAEITGTAGCCWGHLFDPFKISDSISEQVNWSSSWKIFDSIFEKDYLSCDLLGS